MIRNLSNSTSCPKAECERAWGVFFAEFLVDEEESANESSIKSPKSKHYDKVYPCKPKRTRSAVRHSRAAGKFSVSKHKDAS